MQVLSRRPLCLALLAALSASPFPALAACDPAVDGRIVCDATGGTLDGIDVRGVEDVEVVVKGTGNVVDGGLKPEAETAVVVFGDGDIRLSAEEGSVIRGHAGWPALEVGSTDGNVAVDVDTVLGGNVGISAFAGGNVEVKANLVAGDLGIEAHSLAAGNVTVDVQEAYGGAFGAGVWATAQDGDVHIGADRTWAAGDVATGLWGTSHEGSVTIDANFVRAEGKFSTGILAESFAVGDVNIGVNTVTAGGIGAVAILAVAVDGDINIDAGFVGKSDGEGGGGIGAYAVNGGANIRVDQVMVAGDASRALDVQTTRDANVDVGWASTEGYGSHAVNVESAAEANIKVGGAQTHGPDSYGVYAIANDSITLDAFNVNTFGALSAAVFAEAGFDGDIDARIKDVWARDAQNEWFAVGLNANAGDVTVLAEGTVHAENGYAITTSTFSGTSWIQVAEGAAIHGGTTALDSATGGGARFDILGTIDSGTGPVIRAQHSNGGNGHADVRIGRTGTVHGYVQLTGADDRVSNAGTWFAGGTSVFGAGHDRVVNLGTLALDGGDAWACFDGLETFENAGRVSLANGRTGDRFGTTGTVHGAGGSFGVDLDLATGKSDQIHAARFTGVSLVDLDIVGRGTGLGLSDVVIAKSASEQRGDELVLSNDSLYRGFVGFDLRHQGGEWLLSSDLADEAYLAAAVPAGVRDLWRQGAQSVATHLAATRGGEDNEGLWLQAVGGDFDGTSTFSHARGGRELAWHGSHEGVQGGFELAFGKWRAGVTGGFAEAGMDIGTHEETTLDTVNAGVYARFDHNGWFAGGLVRAERVDVDTRWDSIGLQADGDGSTLGVELDGGYVFDMGTAYLAPTLRVNWIDISLPDQVGRMGTVRWEDGLMSTGEVGVRFGASEGWHGVRPYASASYAREFGDADETLYDLGTEEVRVSDAGGRAFGRIAAGLDWRIGRFDLYGDVETRVGDMEGTTGRLGARVRF